MTLSISPSALSGCFCAPVSKSAAHRLLICATLADEPTKIAFENSNEDIDATLACLAALGAGISRSADSIVITPIGAAPKIGGVLDCGESGSTERFLLPVVCALGADATLTGRGRLPQRPLSPLYEVLSAHGAKLSENGRLPLFAGGKLTPGDYEIDGRVSSQFISGLLFALPLLDAPSTVTVTGKMESEHYIEMTLDALDSFDIPVQRCGNRFTVPSARYHSPGILPVEGDWSSAAFFLAAGAIGKHPVSCTGLDYDSLQGDKEIFSLLSDFGAKCTVGMDRLSVGPGKLHGTRIDGANIPDLIPILAVVAAFAEGETVFTNVARLRIKESDRIEAIRKMLFAMGIESVSDANNLIVLGGHPVGGKFDSFNDHRIAMSAAIAACAASGESTLTGAEAVRKSYPGFWKDFAALGGKFSEITV